MNGFEWAPCIMRYWNGESVKLLSFAAQGAYWRILVMQFAEGSVPSDLKKLSKLMGCDSADLVDVWPEIESKFVESEPGRMLNVRMAEVRFEQQQKAEKASGKASKAAAARWTAKPAEPASTDASSNAQAIPEHDKDDALSNAPSIPSSNAQAMPTSDTSSNAPSNAQAMPLDKTRIDKNRQDKEPLELGVQGEEIEDSPTEPVIEVDPEDEGKSKKVKAWEKDLFDRLPLTHQTAELKLALKQYGQLRRAKGWGSFVEITLIAKAKEWAALDVSQCVAALNRSTEQGWQSVNPKNEKPPVFSNTPSESKANILAMLEGGNNE